MSEAITLGDLFLGIRWTDIVDILVVAACIYALLRLISGTRALNLLRGLALVGMAKYAAQKFNLYSFEWLINTFMALGVAAVVILFQPELRKALEHLGRGAFPRLSVSHEELSRIAREITWAATRLATTRTGALIVLQNRTGLREHADTGVSLSAEVSARLLVTLFHPGTPLHDGAVIVAGDKIEAAGCFLPLSQGGVGGLELGTRHRAAVGITEISDAVVVAVSEESGLITWVQGGQLERGISAGDLESRLQRFFGLEPGGPSKQREAAGAAAVSPHAGGQPATPPAAPARAAHG